MVVADRVDAGVEGLDNIGGAVQHRLGDSGEVDPQSLFFDEPGEAVVDAAVSFMGVPPARGFLPASKGFFRVLTGVGACLEPGVVLAVEGSKVRAPYSSFVKVGDFEKGLG